MLSSKATSVHRRVEWVQFNATCANLPVCEAHWTEPMTEPAVVVSDMAGGRS